MNRDIPQADIDRVRRLYLGAVADVMSKERKTAMTIHLSDLMSAYAEVIAKCSNPGMAVETTKGMADALIGFAEENRAELERIAAESVDAVH